MAETLIKNFKQISKADTEIAGGKGASLGEMTQAGIPVPEGFVVLSNAFDRFLEETDLNIEIDAVLDTVDIKEVHTVENASEKIQAMILSREMPNDIKTEIAKFYKNLDCKFVAVRSSATSEDSASAAWAGQLDSFLNTTEETLLENIKKCWASLFTPRAIFYRFEKKLNKNKISVAVVVQKMVDSEESGIAFSVHPVTQDENQIIIEAGFGLGESIVSGSITPDSYVVDKQGFLILDITVNEQTKALYKKTKGGNEWKELGEKGKKQVLTGKEIIELSKLIIKIENHYGFPCDIEWAKEKGKFYIVQSRPITTIHNAVDLNFSSDYSKIVDKLKNKKWKKRGKWHHTVAFSEILLEGESTKSSEKLGLPFKRHRCVWFGNGDYYDLEKDWDSIRKILRKEYAKDKNYIIKYGNGCLKHGNKIIEYVENIKNINFQKISNVKILQHYKKLVDICKDYMPYMFSLHIFDEFLSEKFESLLKKYIEEKGLKIDDFFEYQIALALPFKKIFVLEERDTFSKLTIKGNTSQNNLKKHLNKYAWINSILLEERPYTLEYYNKRIKDFNKPEIKEDYLKRSKEEKKLKVKQKELMKQISHYTELHKISEALQLFGFLRSFRVDVLHIAYGNSWNLITEISNRLNIKDLDLRYFDYGEVKKAILKNEKLTDITETKKIDKEVVSVAINNRRYEISNLDVVNKIKSIVYVEEKDLDSKNIKGTIAYPGKIVGKCKILHNLKDMKKVNRGDIIVVSMTDPNYIPAMEKAAAFITDFGGILCHAAIVSREMKKPCIIGTKNATKILKDNSIIELDAYTGIVKIIKR